MGRMATITSAKISQNSGETSAVAVVKTVETGNLCIVIVLSCLTMGGKKYATLYINVDIKGGNVEQTLALTAIPLNCKTALGKLVNTLGFRTVVIEPVVRKVLEEIAAAK